MTNRRFYRTVVQIEVLSEEPLSNEIDIGSLYYDITEGDCSGSTEVITRENVNGKRIADLLSAQGSDPQFFQVDNDGNDVEL